MATTCAYSKCFNSSAGVDGHWESTIKCNKFFKGKAWPHTVLNLNTFGNDSYIKQQFSQVYLQLQGKSKGIEISPLCYPMICSSLLTTLELDRYPYLRKLDLADENLINRDSVFALNIDVLIISDYYFDVITGEI